MKQQVPALIGTVEARPPLIYCVPAIMICECEKGMEGELYASSPMGRKFTLILRCKNSGCKHFDKPYKLPFARTQLEHA